LVRHIEDGTRRRAFENLVAALRLDKRLPENVFSEAWRNFLFFQSDWMFTELFVDALRAFFDAEGASVACLLRLSEADSPEFEKAAALYLGGTTVGSDYEARLRGNGPPGGWLYGMDRYACASDVGDWCIYCEKENDVAVVALRGVDGLVRFRSALESLRADSLESIYDSNGRGVFPFTKLTTEWRLALADHYQRSRMTI
jgi:hypothetical protein